MKRATLPLLSIMLTASSVHAQYGGMVNPAMMLNPLTMGVTNPGLMLNPLTMGMMNPTMMAAPVGGFGGMNPAQQMTNPYLNPTSSLMPFLGSPSSGFGNPYLMPAPPPRQQTGFFPYMPTQPAPAKPAQVAPQTSFFPMMPVTAPAPAPAPAPSYGYYGMPAPAPAPAPQGMGSFTSFFPAMPAAQPAPPAAAPKAAAAPAANLFDAAAWAQMFPNSVPPNMQAQPAAPASAAAQAAQPAPAMAQPAPAGAPNYFDPNMWMQWMVPATPK